MTKPTITWEELTFRALLALHDPAHLSEIYGAVKALCLRQGRPLTKTWECTVRRTLQQSGRTENVRPGFWRLTDSARAAATESM